MPLRIFWLPCSWRGRPIFQRRVWPFGVVVDAPAFRQHLRFLQRVEDLSVEKLIAQSGVEALAVAVLPRRSRFDIKSACADAGQPLTQFRSNKLRAVVRPNVRWDAVLDHGIG